MHIFAAEIGNSCQGGNNLFPVDGRAVRHLKSFHAVSGNDCLMLLIQPIVDNQVTIGGEGKNNIFAGNII